MKQTKTIKREMKVISDVICNMCEASCKRATGYYGLIEHTVRGGYDSNPLEDETLYTFSMCEVCLKTIFDQFKIPPEEKLEPVGAELFREGKLEFERNGDEEEVD